jgi:hypothetical protein
VWIISISSTPDTAQTHNPFLTDNAEKRQNKLEWINYWHEVANTASQTELHMFRISEAAIQLKSINNAIIAVLCKYKITRKKQTKK